jgi:hypothetical protein
MSDLCNNCHFLPDFRNLRRIIANQIPKHSLSLLFLSLPPIIPGKVQEWFNWHAWKACRPQKGLEGSNPSLSAESQ